MKLTRCDKCKKELDCGSGRIKKVTTPYRDLDLCDKCISWLSIWLTHDKP